jgi:hypothetical protein
VSLPLWFLLLSLLLPRVSLLIAYFTDTLTVFSLTTWVSPTLGVLIPRALVLILIFQDRGMSPWLLVHAFVDGGRLPHVGWRRCPSYTRFKLTHSKVCSQYEQTRTERTHKTQSTNETENLREEIPCPTGGKKSVGTTSRRIQDRSPNASLLLAGIG